MRCGQRRRKRPEATGCQNRDTSWCLRHREAAPWLLHPAPFPLVIPTSRTCLSRAFRQSTLPGRRSKATVSTTGGVDAVRGSTKQGRASRPRLWLGRLLLCVEHTQARSESSGPPHALPDLRKRPSEAGRTGRPCVQPAGGSRDCSRSGRMLRDAAG